VSRLCISVVTPSFNQARFLERAVQSVVTQQGDFDLQYLVMDGGSADGSVDLLRRYDARLSWVSEPDGGQSAAINKGLRRATGDVVGWLNSDDVLLPGALARVAAAFRERPDAEWLHGRCDIIDSEGRVIRQWVSAYKHWCCRRYSYSRLLGENFISQMTVFWRRSLLDAVGYLDPGLHLAMDYDLWLRFARRGAPLYVPERLACFRWYASSKSGAGYREQFRVECEIARKHAPDRTWLHLMKRLKTARAAAAYRLMALLEEPAEGSPSEGGHRGGNCRG
jgi:glycosyltransferase involved in cell wall biosynthesis